MTRYGRAERRLPFIVRLLPGSVRRAMSRAIIAAIDEALTLAEDVPAPRPLAPMRVDVWITPKGTVGVRAQERF